ncbi:MAG: hypothetical protein ACR2MA_00130 [Egibacteraceae bacterium]
MARKALHAETIKALMAVEGEDERTLVRHLYWYVPALPVTVLQAVVSGAARVRELAGQGPRLGSCERGNDVHAHSRTQLVASQDPGRCASCERRLRHERTRPLPMSSEYVEMQEPPDEDDAPW